jgi:hypothetical protein
MDQLAKGDTPARPGAPPPRDKDNVANQRF